MTFQNLIENLAAQKRVTSRFAFVELSQGHLIYRPNQAKPNLSFVAPEEPVTCQNP